MIRVKFNDSRRMITAEFKLLAENTVELSGEKVMGNTSRFQIFRLNGKKIGDYSDYTIAMGTDKGVVCFRR